MTDCLRQAMVHLDSAASETKLHLLRRACVTHVELVKVRLCPTSLSHRKSSRALKLCSIYRFCHSEYIVAKVSILHARRATGGCLGGSWLDSGVRM